MLDSQVWFTLLQGVFGVGLGIWERVGGDRLYDFDGLIKLTAPRILKHKSMVQCGESQGGFYSELLKKVSYSKHCLIALRSCPHHNFIVLHGRTPGSS